MASPQVENGYTKVANEILEQVYKTNLSAYESRVLWFVIRKTYGWDKRTDRLSVSQIANGTDLDRGNAGKALRKLKSRNMILTEGDQIGFQKDHEKWGCVSADTGGVSLQTPVSRSTSKGVSLQTPQHKEEKKEEIPPSPKAHPVQFPSPSRKKKQTAAGTAPGPAQVAAIEKTVHRLNELSGKNYRPDSKDINEYLAARLKDGATEGDCLLVVEDRWHRWKDKPDMVEYFNPVTLFRPSNFEKYLTEARANGNSHAAPGGFVG